MRPQTRADTGKHANAPLAADKAAGGARVRLEHESPGEACTYPSTAAHRVNLRAAACRRDEKSARQSINIAARTKPAALADRQKRNATRRTFDHLSLPLPTSLMTSHAFSVVVTREKTPETLCDLPSLSYRYNPTLTLYHTAANAPPSRAQAVRTQSDSPNQRR